MAFVVSYLLEYNGRTKAFGSVHECIATRAVPTDLLSN